MSKPSNVENYSHIHNLNDKPHEDMDEEILDDLGILGHDKKGGSSSSRRKNTSSKHEFRE